jgi:zinc transporter 9
MIRNIRTIKNSLRIAKHSPKIISLPHNRYTLKYPPPQDNPISAKIAEDSDIGYKAVVSSLKGNLFITVIKCGAYAYSGSAAMLAETFHSMLDLVNQGLLYLGIRQSKSDPDVIHQFGYGKASYFWSLVSAMGIFWIGCIGCIYNGVSQIAFHQTMPEFGWITGIVLFTSFAVDFSVFAGVVKNIQAVKKETDTLLQHVKKIKDPTVLAVLLEDLGATTGVLLAAAGIALTQYTQNPIYDGLSSVLIGVLLGAVAYSMIMMNKRFLIGQAVDPETILEIRKLLLARPSIEEVLEIRSQWVSPHAFMIRAEINFDGFYLASILNQLGYEKQLLGLTDLDQVRKVMGPYSEDLTRLVEKEVREIEKLIRKHYPEASFIDLEPYSKKSHELLIH